jgi:hypothetical protein
MRRLTAILILALAPSGLVACGGKPVHIPGNGSAVGARIDPAAGNAPSSGGAIGRAVAASRCTVHVSPGGSPTASGRSEHSPTSLLSAVSRAAPGDVVCLAGGTYETSSNIILTRSGTSSAPIIYSGEDDGRTLIRYTGGSLSGGVLQTAKGANWGGAHDVVLRNMTIDGGDLIGAGIFVAPGSHHITIVHCTIRDTGATGIALNAVDYVKVVDNVVFHAGYNQGWSGGISLWYGGSSPTYGGPTAWYDRAPGFHNYIVGNIIAGTVDDSAHHTDGSGIIVDGSGSIPPALIANNIVYENGASGIEVYHTSGEVWIVNNTAYANGLDLRVRHGTAADFEAIQATAVHLVNNLAYGYRDATRYPNAYLYKSIGSSSIDWAHNLAFNGSTIGVPSDVTGNRSEYIYVDPRLTALPPVSDGDGDTPWADAPPPWGLGSAFSPEAGSRALHAGADPSAVPGVTALLAAGIRRYAP